MAKESNHMTIETRIRIHSLLDQGKNYKEIAIEVGKAVSTVMREVKKHTVVKHSSPFSRNFNDCAKRSHKDCPVRYSCETSIDCTKDSCSDCKKGSCGPKCREYVKYVCPKLKRPPYVCNGCEKSNNSRCGLEKKFYEAKVAQDEYRSLLSECREGIHISEDEVNQLNQTLKQAIAERKQSINHVFSYADGTIPASQTSIYRYINRGIFPDVRRIDQPKAIRYRATRAQYAYNKENDQDKTYLIGRSYTDYKGYLESNSVESVVQMDCVEGKRGGNGRALLTLLFTNCSLQLAFVLESKSQDNVISVFTYLRKLLGLEEYKKLFGIILTDRGTEFRDPEKVELDENGEIVSHVFYWNPMNPNQKGACERNHEEIRRILKKGTEITFSQEGANVLMSNIASMPRPKFANRSAYEMFCFYYGSETLKKLGLSLIPSAEVTLSPNLLLTLK